MRTIKFRGKNRKTGKWFYSNLFDKDTKGNTHIGTTSKGSLDVIPDTVGQFTGLTDKNGKEIYEGDILGWEWNYKEIKGIDIKFKSISYICFEDSEWKCKDLHGNSVNLSSLAEILKPEIIGNIHDNPELLKTETL